jgi:hypothetical protein
MLDPWQETQNTRQTMPVMNTSSSNLTAKSSIITAIDLLLPCNDLH